MKRRLLIALFAAGTVIGFGSGLAHLWRAHARRAGWHGCQGGMAHSADKH